MDEEIKGFEEQKVRENKLVFKAPYLFLQS